MLLARLLFTAQSRQDSSVDTYPQSGNYRVAPLAHHLEQTNLPPPSLLSLFGWNRRTAQKSSVEPESRKESTSPLVFGYPLERYRAELVNLIWGRPENASMGYVNGAMSGHAKALRSSAILSRSKPLFSRRIRSRITHIHSYWPRPHSPP